ncbi:hypothetical protein NPIL_342481 [Nephila pilipes]|uniref:Uncharacterized protein n=1 Tax=Nephila pilipes TaxID=299642 RepID=A0A8X6U3P0_NEPPI|nr:hypothetical protein NPIL_342481 [Nephila pilipes]
MVLTNLTIRPIPLESKKCALSKIRMNNLMRVVNLEQRVPTMVPIDPNHGTHDYLSIHLTRRDKDVCTVLSESLVEGMEIDIANKHQVPTDTFSDIYNYTRRT